MTVASEKSLYDRLGGYDAIAAVTDSFLERLFTDPQLAYYWKGHSDDTKKKERQLIVDFLCEASGGSTFYVGRDMTTSHLGLGISASDWETMMAHCVATLDEFQVNEQEKNDVCSFLDSLKAEIIEQA